MDRRQYSLALIVCLSLVAFIGMLFIAPIAQNGDYHNFVDARSVFAVHNFCNVISNIVFVLAGALGLQAVAKGDPLAFPKALHIAYRVFFVGVMLVAVGSGYYHLAPNNVTLVWDRLPMTIAFMALFSVILGEYVSLNLGRKMLLPLIICGAAAVAYWWYTEFIGRGDLRAYILVQFLPMLLSPLILILFRSVFGSANGYWQLFGCYVVAKICEYWDGPIYALGLGLSGHTLKHIIAAVGVLALALAYKKRRAPDASGLTKKQ